MLKTLYSRHGGAATGNAAVILSVIMAVTAVFSLSAAKYAGVLNHATVTDNGNTVRRLTAAQTAEAFIDELEREIDPLDHIRYIGIGENGSFDVEIEHAFPLTVTADGETRDVRAAGITVGELLGREGYELGIKDSTIVKCKDCRYFAEVKSIPYPSLRYLCCKGHNGYETFGCTEGERKEE